LLYNILLNIFLFFFVFLLIHFVVDVIGQFNAVVNLQCFDSTLPFTIILKQHFLLEQPCLLNFLWQDLVFNFGHLIFNFLHLCETLFPSLNNVVQHFLFKQPNLILLPWHFECLVTGQYFLISLHCLLISLPCFL